MSPSKRVARNISANILGRAWMMLMSFAFVPIYIRLLGVESYGIIGFFATLMVVFSVLDLGLSATLNREMARRSALEHEHEGMSDIVRTLEAIYWVIGLAIGGLVFLLAPVLAHDWLNESALPATTVERSIRLMGAALALQWPTGLYGGGLMGLQQQVRANLIDIAMASLRGIGAIGILYFVSTSLEAYFIWQVLVCGVAVFLMRALLWRSLPAINRKPRVDLPLFQTLWQFAAGMTGISVLSVIIMQADKMLLSAVLPLAGYAHYLLASGLAAACSFMIGPIATALYPKLTQSVAAQDRADVLRIYHRGCEMVALAIVPVVVTVAIFPFELILFWTHNADLAQSAAPIARLLALGTGFNGLMQVPYLLQLSNGSTRLTLIANTVAVIAVTPLVYVLATRYGAVGAAWGWPIINGFQLVIVTPFIHNKFLPGVNRRWAIRDIALPIVVALLAGLAVRLLVPEGLPPLEGFVAVALAGGFTLGCTALALPSIRAVFLHSLPSHTLRATKPEQH